MAEHPLAGLGTATVHEAYGGRGALPSAIKPVHPGFRLCGPAFTVDCPPGDNLGLHRAIYRAARGDVIVADVRGHTEAGYWGEILTHAALARGLGGLLIAGGVRDLAEISTLGFPIFASAVCIRGTTKNPNGGVRLHEPIRIGEIDIHPGDTVVADLDGAVLVRAADVADVAVAARARIAAEGEALERIRRGESTLEIYGLAG